MEKLLLIKIKERQFEIKTYKKFIIIISEINLTKKYII